MKTIIIRLPDVEAAMLLEVQKRNKDFRDPGLILIALISAEYKRLKGS